MLRHTAPSSPVCGQCEQPGVHGSHDACLSALRDALRREPPRRGHVPAPAILAPVRPRVRQRTAAIDADWLTINQACAVVQMSRHALYDWMRDGKVQWQYTAGGQRRIKASSLWRIPEREG